MYVEVLSWNLYKIIRPKCQPSKHAQETYLVLCKKDTKFSPISSMTQKIVWSTAAEIICPVMQAFGEITLLQCEHCIHGQEVLLETIYQRNGELFDHDLLFSHNHQSTIISTILTQWSRVVTTASCQIEQISHLLWLKTMKESMKITYSINLKRQ